MQTFLNCAGAYGYTVGGKWCALFIWWVWNQIGARTTGLEIGKTGTIHIGAPLGMSTWISMQTLLLLPRALAGMSTVM